MRRGALYLCRGDPQDEKELLIEKAPRDTVPVIVYRDDCGRPFLERDLDRLLEVLKDNNVNIIITRLDKLSIGKLSDLVKIFETFRRTGIDIYLIDMPALSDLPIDVRVRIVEELSRTVSSSFSRRRLEELRRSGRLFHRPTLLHYIALYLTGRERLADLSENDLRRAIDIVRMFLMRERLKCRSLRELYERFLREFSYIWDRYPNAPRSFKAFYTVYRRVLSLSRDLQS